MSIDHSPVYSIVEYEGQVCPITTAKIGVAEISILHVGTAAHWWTVRIDNHDVAEGQATSQPEARTAAETAARAAHRVEHR
jgi:hypothetical protein